MHRLQPGSITQWIADIRSHNDEDAKRELVERFFQRVRALAERLLSGIPRRLTDAEQVAVNALYALLRGIELGRFPDLYDRQDLWCPFGKRA